MGLAERKSRRRNLGSIERKKRMREKKRDTSEARQAGRQAAASQPVTEQGTQNERKVRSLQVNIDKAKQVK